MLQSQQQEDHSGLHSLGLEVWLLPVLEIVLRVSIRSKAFLGDENYFGATAIPWVPWALAPGPSSQYRPAMPVAHPSFLDSHLLLFSAALGNFLSVAFPVYVLQDRKCWESQRSGLAPLLGTFWAQCPVSALCLCSIGSSLTWPITWFCVSLPCSQLFSGTSAQVVFFSPDSRLYNSVLCGLHRSVWCKSPCPVTQYFPLLSGGDIQSGDTGARYQEVPLLLEYMSNGKFI